MVDDGSTDGSAAIASEFADARPALPGRRPGQRRPRRGPQHRRRGGRRRAARVPGLRRRPAAHACELLLRLARRRRARTSPPATSSGYGRRRPSQAPFLARAFAETRPKTHITQFRAAARRPHRAEQALAALVLGRSTASASPRACIHEDIPVVDPRALPGAQSVDVISEPVYLYRVRESGDLSITQRRPEPKVAARPPDRRRARRRLPRRARRRRAKRWYDESVVAEDLRYYLNVLTHADEAYRSCSSTRSTRSSTRARPTALQAAAGDRAAQVGARAPAADAGAAGGHPLPARGARRARRRVRDRRALVRRLPLPHRRRLGIPPSVYELRQRAHARRAARPRALGRRPAHIRARPSSAASPRRAQGRPARQGRRDRRRAPAARAAGAGADPLPDAHGAPAQCQQQHRPGAPRRVVVRLRSIDPRTALQVPQALALRRLRHLHQHPRGRHPQAPHPLLVRSLAAPARRRRHARRRHAAALRARAPRLDQGAHRRSLGRVERAPPRG